jgi:hypothetical protein
MDYLKVNKAAWNERTKVHIDSEFYDNKAFIAGKSSLNPIELEQVGDVVNKKITASTVSLWPRYPVLGKKRCLGYRR